MNEKTLKRFFAKVKITPGCWIWTASLSNKGYGRFHFGGGEKKGESHRFSYKHFVGEIPDGKFVCHRCDNTKCVNPDHLFLGTQSENMKDMHKKGRAPLLPSKLSNEQINEIRNTKMLLREISEKFGITTGYASQIRTGKYLIRR